eukprot:jgi/Botrbrau1/8557/Bobra.0359s0021.1
MGVPTMYAILISVYQDMTPEEQREARRAAAALRLTISGSAACPLPIMSAWRHISGQTLLERYGMTETGMIISNPYRGERRGGFVGLPLPGVSVKCVPPVLPEVSDADGDTNSPPTLEGSGEIRVKGANLFKEYWNRPDATAESFDEEGYFMTGDTGVLEGEPAYWRILGRTSVDIIKSGGYKISALGIENVLLAIEGIRECAVLGLPHPVMGELVAAVVAFKDQPLTLEQIRSEATAHLPPYQLPRVLKEVDSLPRNAMGKINKKSLLKELFAEELAKA